MGSPAGAHRRSKSVRFEAEHLPAQEQKRTERLVLRARRNMLSQCELSQVVADQADID